MSVLFFFSHLHLRGRGALCLSSYLKATSPKVTIFKNGLRSAEAFRNENGSGADYVDERARGGTLRLGRTGLGGYVKFAVIVFQGGDGGRGYRNMFKMPRGSNLKDGH